MYLNHPKTYPSAPSVEKPTPVKLVPAAKKAGDRCFSELCLWIGSFTSVSQFIPPPLLGQGSRWS